MTVDSDRPTRRRQVAGWVLTVLACLLLLFVLIAPNQLSHLRPAAFVRLPVEAIGGLALLLVLPARARLVVAAVVGVAFGLFAVVKIADMGFFTFLERPFDPMFDWNFLDAAVRFLVRSSGRGTAYGLVVAAVLLAVAMVTFTTLSVLRLTRLAVRHRAPALRTVKVLWFAWLICALLGLQIVPDGPVAAHPSYDRLLLVRAGLQDQQVFASEVAIDDFRETPGRELLTALRGKDVVVSLVESYGRSAIEHPEMVQQITTVLDDGNRRLNAAGFASRSAFLTSPVSTGGSWLAQATLLSGSWVNSQQRDDLLVTSDRLTLGGAFRRAGWRTVGVMPGITKDWPAGSFFGYDRIYAFNDLGYRGGEFSFETLPDQYALSFFERTERAAPNRGPVMAVIPLTSSHAPWTPVPPLIDWTQVGDGSSFQPPRGAGGAANVVLQRDAVKLRLDYRKSIEYSLKTLISYVETHGDDNLVLVFLGDHQPAATVTGEGAGRDVPITIVARDRAVLDRMSGWGWEDGLKPGPHAPVLRMDQFRDRFLTTFGS